jgi:cytolysin-activating lysine-acyltransferase
LFQRKQTPAAAPAEQSKTESVAPDTSAADAIQRQALQALRQSLAFAQIVSLTIKSPLYRHFAIGDLEWLVVPPLALGTFALAEAKAQADGPAFPVAVALWAQVSPDVDQRLSENLAAPIRLRPDEWASGDAAWVIAAIGDPRALNGLLQQLNNSVFKERTVKIRAAGSDGKVSVKTLKEIFAQPASAA